jgi:ADP-ribose pyrophosphatase
MEDSVKGANEQVTSSRLIYSGRALNLRHEEVRLPNGRTTTREIIEHPGSVGIVPILGDGRIVLIRQFRLAAGEVIWEIPAGTLENGEVPEACARRELEEETGYKAEVLKPLFECYLAPGYSMELMHLFVASSLKMEKQATEEDEIISIEPLELERIITMIGRHEIKDVKTIGAISYLCATRPRDSRGRIKISADD